MERLPAIALLGFAAALSTGLCAGLPSALLLAALLWLPGFAVLCRLDAGTDAERRLSSHPGGIAAAASFSIALFALAAAPAVLAGLPLQWVRFSAAAVFVVAAIASWPRVATRLPRRVDASRKIEWIVAVVAVAVLLPAVWAYAGGKVDDWWDLAFIRSYMNASGLRLAEPLLGGGVLHPRFAWNVWFLLQAFVCSVAGADPAPFQAGALAAAVTVLVVSAVAALSLAVFRDAPRRIAATAFVPLWLYGTEAIPFFSRGYQDKFVAGLVLAPVMLAWVIRAAAGGSLAQATAAAAAAFALCSVHSLVYGLALAVAVGLIVSAPGLRARRGRMAWIVAMVAAPLLYPLWQSVTTAALFAAQGVDLAVPDNPVVRAHLWLDRLAAPQSWYRVVKPSAVFGPVALLAVPGILVAWRERGEAGARALLVMTLVPCLAVFVPLAAALTGSVFVPWMIYRFVWLVPLCLLAGWMLAASPPQARIPVSWLRCIAIAAAAALVLPVATDRVRRDMAARPFEKPLRPEGTTLAAYRFLASAEVSGPVLAPPGFSELVPAMSGRPAVAISERGTLVFSADQNSAYARMYDRARFFSPAVGGEERRRIAREYGGAYAVFRRGYITRGSEDAWLRRHSGEGFLLRTRDATIELPELPVEWPVVFQNDDYTVVETREPRSARVARPSGAAPTAWSRVFAARKGEAPPGTGDVLSSLTGHPGGEARLRPVPVALGNADEAIWSSGPALWDDGPAAVSVELALPGRCRIDRIEVTPFLRRDRREFFELRAGGTTVRSRARDARPIVLRPARTRTDTVRVEVESLMGMPFGLADVRVFGDRSDCEPVVNVAIGDRAELAGLLRLALAFPNDARPAIAVARQLSEVGRERDAAAVLEAALLRDPGLANAQVEYGLVLDRLGRSGDAFRQFERAVRYDSANAWARGCLAWAHTRQGHQLRAWWHAAKAARLDDRYADAFTLVGIAQRSLGLRGFAEASFRRAAALAPGRSWGVFELASVLSDQGRVADAREVLADYVRRRPDDEVGRSHLAGLAGTVAP